MNFTRNLKYVAVLALLAGCATEPETAQKPAEPAKAPVAQSASTLPKSETFDATYRRHLSAVRNWSCHSFPAQVRKGVPAAMEFITANADKQVTHKHQIEELKYRILEALSRARDYETGIPYAEELYKKGDNPHYKCYAASYIALGRLDKKPDYAAADKLYTDILFPARNKSGQHWLVVGMVKARAHLYVLRGDKEGAIKYIDSERALVEAPESWKATMNRYFDEAAVGVFEAFFDYRGELDYFLKRGNKSQAFRILNRGLVSDIPLMTKLSHEIVLDDKCGAGLRTRAWLWLFSRDEKFCRENQKRCYGKERNSTNEFANIVGNGIWANNLYGAYGPLAPAYDRNPAITAKLWEYYVATKKLVKQPIDFRPAQYATLAYSELGDKAKAVNAAAEGLTNAKIGAGERFELELMRRVLEMKGSESAIADQVKAAVVELGKGLSARDFKNYMRRALAVATVGRDETLSRGIAKFYLDNVRATPAKKSYTVRFSTRNVAGAGDWVNLPFKPDESDFDRAYGGHGMSFMTTDVATGDRGNAVQGGEQSRKHPTTLQAVADDWGIHLVFTFYDKRARQFESGELDAGSYESYIAPGENTPYVCFLTYPKKDARGHIANTSYDQPGHRRVNPNDPSKFRTDTIFTDDAVISYLAFSWDSYADYIPNDGDEWDFESIFWGPVQSAWNGTESIHGRSTWGKLRFEIGDAARVKIRRAQLFKAVNLFKAEQKPKQVLPDSVQEGVFSHWSDDELGDVEFYDQCLKPLLAELNPIAEKVKVGMSDADVNEIAGKYLKRFRDIRFEVARLRTEFLSRQFSK